MNTSTLSKLESVRIVGGKTYNPYEYLQTERGGLWADFDTFDKQILPVKGAVTTIKESELGYIDLTRKLSNEKIQRMLPEGYAFEDINHFWGQLAWMIDVQCGGEEGRLQTAVRRNKLPHFNVFYVRNADNGTDAVYTYLHKSDEYKPDFMDEVLPAMNTWHCSQQQKQSGDNYWSKGTRVFSATT